MELKYQERQGIEYHLNRSNRTFMELKLRKRRINACL